MIQIDHEDIRIGDTIRTTYQMGDMLVISKGVVAGFSGLGTPLTKEGFYFDSEGDGVVTHLLNRPKKELPPVGTWVRILSVTPGARSVPENASYTVGFVRTGGLVETLDYAYEASEILDYETLDWK